MAMFDPIQSFTAHTLKHIDTSLRPIADPLVEVPWDFRGLVLSSW